MPSFASGENYWRIRDGTIPGNYTTYSMKRHLRHASHALCIFLSTFAVKANSTPVPGHAGLIPMRPDDALSLAKFVAARPTPGKPDQPTLAVETNHGQLVYDFYTTSGPTIQINAMTGEIDALLVSPRTLPSSYDAKPLRELNTAYLQQQALNFARKAYPKFKVLNKIEAHKSAPPSDADGKPETVDDSFTWDVNLAEETATGIRTLNRATVSVRRDTGQVVRYMLARYTEPQAPLTPGLTGPQAVELARWYLTKGAPTTFQLLLPSEYTQQQRQALGMPATAPPPGGDFSLAVDEDPWLNQQLRWTINLNVGRVTVDAETGRVLSTDASSYMVGPDAQKYMQLFVAPLPSSQPQPHTLPQPTILATLCNVNFNGDMLSSKPGPGALHCPPIVMNQAALIYSNYFPNFMIAVDVHDKQIHLSGQLKGRGHEATLTIGKAAAVINEKPVILSAPPVIVEGRLYLPAELLQLVNGVPTKWDPKKNCLTVTTQKLRRD